MAQQDLKTHLTRPGTWIRGLYMLLFAVLYGLVEILIAAVVIFQFGMMLIQGRTNEQLTSFGRGLSSYVYQIMLFLTYNTDAKPFPFSAWPGNGVQQRIDTDITP
jgi:hypothetical protein